LIRQLLAGISITLFCASAVSAQQPLATAPSSPQFLPRYDFHLSAAALANRDPRFSWDTHFGGEIDVVDYVYGRTSATINYEAILGNEFRAFDPNQGNYTLEIATSYRLRGTEVAATFNHVSRHLSDRPKRFPIAWNTLGVRVLRQETIRNAVVDFVADVGGTTERVNVDYEWAANAGVKVRRQVHRGVGVFAAGSGHLMAVSPERARHTQTGGEIEGGIRLLGEGGVAEFFVGFERRFDAHQIDFQAQRWFMVGFRLLRR
jgi:hypothetical protein